MPPHPMSARPAQRARVLALVADLGSDLATVDLDEIDGEFYWRCARTDLLVQLEALRAKLPPLAVVDSPTAAHDHFFAELRAEQERASAAIFLHIRASILYPHAVWNRLHSGERVPMRAPEVTQWVHHASDEQGTEKLRVKVFSGAWTGADVEREIKGVVADWPTQASTALTSTSVSVRLDFDLVDSPEAAGEYGEGGPHLRLPFVPIVAYVPLHPAGTIGREYEAIVRDLKQWHLALPGVASRQDKEVAVRTWAVGLLMAAGERFTAAMREVCHQADLPEVSQTRFGQDRQRLVERVPEAAAHLYAREEQPRALAKGDAPPAPLQGIAPSDPA